MMKKSNLVLGLVILGLVSLLPLRSLSSGNESKASDTVILSKDNLIVLNTVVEGEATAAIIAQAKALDAKLSAPSRFGRDNANKNKPLYLFLNTPGGSIQSGLELIEALHGIGRPVNTVTLFAASMGFQIAQNLDERLILKNGVLMSHRAKGGFEGEFGGPSPSQVESRYNLWISRLKELDQQTVDRTHGKQTLDSYQKAYANELWLTGTQSVQQGYADRIVTVKCDSSLAGVTTNHVDFMGFDIAYDLDNCPINTSPMNVRAGAPASGGLSTTFTLEKREEIKNKFLEQYEKKQHMVVPMSW